MGLGDRSKNGSIFNEYFAFMASDRTLLMAAGAAFLYFKYGRKAAGAKRLEFYPESIDLSNIKLTNWQPDLLVRVVNPAGVSQTVDAVFLNVFANKTQIGRIQITQRLEIKKQSDVVVRVPIKIFALGTGTIIAKLIKGESVKFTIVGTVSSMGFTIPIEVALN